MIIKGKSRAAPSQLAAYLMRSEKNERTKLLQLVHPVSDLKIALVDWQISAGATKGELGLYHAQISPHARYEMTPAQWERAADILAEELGLAGQQRAIVLHTKDGREHAHVVYSRVDLDTMTLRTDSNSYDAHERASHRLELEFGHEIVPGKHTKRDREKQPEIPRSETNHYEHQQAERTGVSADDLKADVRKLFEASDTGPAFKAALEDAGYLLAQGDRRDFVVIDQHGSLVTLARVLPGKTAGVREFLQDVNRDALPTAAEARALQRNSQRERATAEPGAMEDEAARRADALREACRVRYAEELAVQERIQGQAITALQERHLQASSAAIDELAQRQAREAVAARPGEPGFWQSVREGLSPALREARLAAEAERARTLELSQETEMRVMLAGMESQHRADMSDLIAAQVKERDELTTTQKDDLSRRLADDDRAQALAQEYESRARDGLEQDREGPDRAR